MYLILTAPSYYSGTDMYGTQWTVRDVVFSEDEAKKVAARLAYAHGLNGVMVVQKLDLTIG